MAIKEKAKKLDKVLKSLEKFYSRSVLPEGDDSLERLIFYWLFYTNPVTNARKAVKMLEDPDVFGDWNEVRVATQRELEDIFREARIEDAEALAPRIKTFLQNVFEELDDTSIEPLKELKPDKAKRFLAALEGVPPWAITYMFVTLGLDTAIPWDPHTERVASRIRVIDPNAPLPQRKKLLRAALEDGDPLRLNHLFVEHGKKTCTEEDPKCPKCPVNKDCEYYLRRGARAAKPAAPAPTNGGNGNGTAAPPKAKNPKKK
jgi:endonuclease III